MRTTFDIDEDVLQAAKELAAAYGVTAGKMLSNLARKGLEPRSQASTRNGVPLLPRRPATAPRLTMAFVNQLRDDE